eukprot:4300380-Heterocapsa_arctica.AAC.1
MPLVLFHDINLTENIARASTAVSKLPRGRSCLVVGLMHPPRQSVKQNCLVPNPDVEGNSSKLQPQKDLPPFKPQRSPSPWFHADNLGGCLSDRVFKAPHEVPSCSSRRNTFWGSCPGVCSARKNNVFACR